MTEHEKIIPNHDELIRIGRKAELILAERFYRQNKKALYEKFVQNVLAGDDVDDENNPIVLLILKPNWRELPEEIETLVGTILTDDEGNSVARIRMAMPQIPQRTVWQKIKGIFRKKTPSERLRRFLERKEREGIDTTHGFKEGTHPRPKITCMDYATYFACMCWMLLLPIYAHYGNTGSLAAYSYIICIVCINFFNVPAPEGEELSQTTRYARWIVALGVFIGGPIIWASGNL